MNWYVQERSNGVNARGTEILAAAGKLATHRGISDFKSSEGWLWRIRNRHGLFNQWFNKVLHGEAGDDDESSVAPFREKLNNFISDEELFRFLIYNANETSIFWRSMPKIPRYAEVRKMPRERNQARRDSLFLLGLMLQ